MFYEISREVFKQRVEKPLNFAVVDLTQGGSGLPKVSELGYSDNFIALFSEQYPDKNQNILLFTLDDNDSSSKVAGQKLSDEGYHFVYYYQGSKEADALIGQR